VARRVRRGGGIVRSEKREEAALLSALRRRKVSKVTIDYNDPGRSIPERDPSLSTATWRPRGRLSSARFVR
jgi:hypothetical protein